MSCAAKGFVKCIYSEEEATDFQLDNEGGLLATFLFLSEAFQQLQGRQEFSRYSCLLHCIPVLGISGG